MHGLETMMRLNAREYCYAQERRMEKLAARARRKGNDALAQKWTRRGLEYHERAKYVTAADNPRGRRDVNGNR